MNAPCPLDPVRLSELVADMQPAQLTRALAKARAESDAICDALIAAGRGHERPSETRTLADPLALRWQANARTLDTLNAEHARRMEWHGSLKRIPRPVW